METVANENTAPAGEVFSDTCIDYATGLSMGTLAAGQRYGLWIQRTITAGAAAVNDDAVTIKYDCDTAA
jgi:hypothetical protein